MGRHYKTEEHDSQVAVINWTNLARHEYPEASLIFSIPNGGGRSKAEAGRLKASGVKSGVPDLCLPVARGGYFALYLEQKSTKGVLSEAQKDRGKRLIQDGYMWVVAYSAEESIRHISQYLKMPKTRIWIEEP